MTRLKPHSRFGWWRDERLRPRPFLLQAHSAPTRFPVGVLQMAARNPTWASVRLPGDPTCRLGSVHRVPQGAGMEDAGQGGGQTRWMPCQAQGSPHLVQETASIGRYLIWGRASECKLQGASRSCRAWGLPQPLS